MRAISHLLFTPTSNHPFLAGTLVGDFEKTIAAETPRNQNVLRAVFCLIQPVCTHGELAAQFGISPSRASEIVRTHRARLRRWRRDPYGRLALLLDRYIIEASILPRLADVSKNRYFAGPRYLRPFLLTCFDYLPAQLPFTLVFDGHDDFIVPCSARDWREKVAFARAIAAEERRLSDRAFMSALYDLVADMPDMEIAVPLLRRVSLRR